MNRTRGRPRAGRSGLTLLEVVVSAAIISLLALVIMSSTLPLSNASSDTAIALDMDRIAAKVLLQLRKDLRQSGFDGASKKYGETTVGVPGNLEGSGGAASVIVNDKVFNTTTQTPEWSATTILWDVRTDAQGVRHVTRSVNGAPQSWGGAPVATLNVKVPAPAASMAAMAEVTLTLQHRSRTRPGTMVTRTYTDFIQMMNYQ